MAATGRITIREARTPEALRQAQAIREQVFVVEQGIPTALDRDGLDDASIHVVAYHDGAAVATGRLTVLPEGEAVIARIAVVPAYRGRGLGKRIVQRLERLARREGVRVVTLHPHHYLEAFYRDLGYATQLAGTIQAGPYRLITMQKRL